MEPEPFDSSGSCLTFHLGPAGSGKTSGLLELHRARLRSAPGTACWLAPSSHAVEDVLRRLPTPAQPALPAPTVLTFAGLVERLLDDDPPSTAGLLCRELLLHAIRKLRKAKRLRYFGTVAGTPGFLGRTAEWIERMQTQDIGPDRLTGLLPDRTRDPKNHELALILREYRTLLERRGPIDEGERMREALRLLAEHGSPYRSLVVDGFSDFTVLQQKLLERLTEGATEVHLTLPLEGTGVRAELFAKPLATLAVLRKRFPAAAIRWYEPHPAPPCPALAHLERGLFRMPHEQTPLADAAGLRILVASSAVQEVRLVARRIKEMLLGTAPEAAAGPIAPDDIRIVTRTPGITNPLIDEVFPEYGIPYRLDRPARLASCPPLRHLIDFVRLVDEDWPLRRLTACLQNRCFYPDWDEWKQGQVRPELERLLQHTAVPKGRNRLLRLLAGRAKHLPGWLQSHVDQVHPRVFAQREAEFRRLEATLPFWERFAALADTVPASATRAAWWKAFENVARSTGWFRSAWVHSIPGSGPPPELAAWNRLKDAWEATAELERGLLARPPALSRREFLERLTEIAATEPLPQRVSAAGRVRVVAPEDIRGVRVPYLFVVGLTEGSFPRGGGGSGMYSEAETEELAELGLPWPRRRERRQEEMLLFYETVTRATACLTLGYPGLDDRAQAQLPSPFLSEVEYACNAAAEPPPLRREEHLSLTPRPLADVDGGEPLGFREFRIRAAVAASEGRTADLTAWIRYRPQRAEPLLDAWETAAVRAHGTEFSRYEGMISGPTALAALAERAARPWNTHLLEAYGHCPFRFFAEDILRIVPWESLDLATDHRRRGILLHDSLATLHREAGTGPTASEDQAKRLHALIDARCEREVVSDEVERTLLEVDRRIVHDWAEAYVRQWREDEEKTQGRYRPTYLEWSFGIPRIDAEADPASVVEPLTLADGDRSVQLTGRIDRIDLDPDTDPPRYRIIDYKSGSSKYLTAGQLAAGYLLQLPIYVLALERLLLTRGTAPGSQIGYWFLRETGFEPRLSAGSGLVRKRAVADDPSWNDFLARAERRVTAIVAAVAAGRFPVYSPAEDCTQLCPFRTACRIGQVRRSEKVWQLPERPA